MEAQLLYPGRRVVIVELNSLLGPGSNIFQFAEWFAATRVEDISNADPKVRGFVSTPKAPGVEGKRHRGLAIQYEISHYRRMLREVLQSSLGYQPPDLEGFDYHNLAFDPRHLLKSRSIDTLQLMIQGFSDSRRLWESINSCVKGLGGASLTGDTGPVSDQGKPLRLLGLDGGGVRGLSALLILRRLLEEVKDQFDLDKTPLPCEYFDMIGGTSTGGLIAILLGRLRLSVHDCIKLYEEVAEDIFGVEQPITATTRFSSKRFKDVLQKRIRGILNVKHDETFLQDPKVAIGKGCPIFVVTIERDQVADPEGAILLRSYETDQGISFEESCYLWEAALATCSAPIFFSPAQVKDKILVDGGLGHNNPTEHLIDEAKKRWPDRQLGAVISIGTGKARGNLLARDMKRSAAGKHPVALIHVAKVLKHIATSSEARHRSVYNYFRGLDRLDSYFRFNVDTGMEIELHEYKKYDEIRYHTEKYLNTPGIKRSLISCARKLEAPTIEPVKPLQPRTEIAPGQASETFNEVVDQLTDENEGHNSSESESESLQQLVDFNSPVPIYLNPLYQLESSRPPARIAPLEDISKAPIEAIVEQRALDWNSTKRRQASMGGTQPISGIAYAIDTNSPDSILVFDYKETGLERKIEPGLWRLHWVLLFRRYDIGLREADAEAEGTGPEQVRGATLAIIPDAIGDSADLSRPESPKPATIHLSIYYESMGGKSITVRTTAILGADIPYPAPSFLDENWQGIPMDGLLTVETMDPQPSLNFCLDFSGWDEATSRTGTRHTWTIYFGGIRMTPVNEANV